MPKGYKKLIQFIKSKELSTQIEEVWRKAKYYQDKQIGNNIQGRLHCEAVEANLAKLIFDSKKVNVLKAIDLFVLSAAACLHDIGKVVNDDAIGWESDHGKRSMQIILNDYEKLGLEKGQAIALGYIVSVHTNGKLDELPNEPLVVDNGAIDVIELAALFCLADMLDTNYKRAPEILSNIIFPDGNITSKWRGRQSITGWYLDKANKIILQTAPKRDELEPVHTLKSMMNEALAKISPYLKIYGYPSELGELDIKDIFLKEELRQIAAIKRPFPGMAFYTKDDAAIFRGRYKEIEDLLSIVSNYPITLLIGESGAGKTSLIHAGLFPKLEAMSWDYVWTRPFENPEENIKKTIWSTFFEGEVDSKKSLLDVMKKAAEKCKPHKILVVMDQFEDVLNCKVQKILDDFSFSLTAVQTRTIIPNLRVLIAFREDALVKLNNRLLKKITGSAKQFPSVELERLTRDGAKKALLSGFENAQIGLDPRLEKGDKPLIEVILDNIQKTDDRIYPPYIQMVAETLCKKVDHNNPIINRKIYFDELKGSDNIIAHYLIERLKEFGSQENEAKKVLTFLPSSVGKKAKKNLVELRDETDIEIKELKEILKKMIDLRMARKVGEDEFEIIHDYFGKIVDEELVKEEERTVKFIKEQLESFFQNYKVDKTPIMYPPFLASLYKNRRKIKIMEEKYPFILCTCLLNRGLGWYWLKDVNKKKLFDMIINHISHDIEQVSKNAILSLKNITQPEDKHKIIEISKDKDWRFRTAAVKALSKISQPEDRDKIIKMLDDENSSVREVAVKALSKIAKSKDRSSFIKMLRDIYWSVREAAIEALGKIAKPEDRGILLQMLDDENDNIREAAAKALIMIAQPDDKGMFMGMLKDENMIVRAAAKEALVNIVQPKDRDNLIKMLRDKRANFRIAAIESLSKIAKPEDKDTFILMLNDEYFTVSEAANEALIKIAQPEDRAKFIKMLCDENWLVRKAAVEALVKIAQPNDRDNLIKMLDDEDGSVRKAAVEALVKIAQPEDRDRLIDMLEDEDCSVREAAVESLSKITQPEDRDNLIKMLDDKDYFVREATLETLAKIAQPVDRDRLIKILDNEDWLVSEVKLEALLNMLQPEDREFILDFLSDQAQGWGKKQIEMFELLSYLDRKFYCPFPWED